MEIIVSPIDRELTGPLQLTFCLSLKLRKSCHTTGYPTEINYRKPLHNGHVGEQRKVAVVEWSDREAGT